MRLVDLTDDDRTALDAALRTTKRVREWRRLQAVRLLAEGHEAPEVAQVLGCSASSVYYWRTFRTPIQPFSQLWRSRAIPGNIRVFSNRRQICLDRPTLGT